MDDRKSSPAALRNRGPILEFLRTVLPNEGVVLEIASGSGEHVVHFASALPGLTWQPSDPNPGALASIAAWAAAEGPSNIRQPIALDAADDDWPLHRADAILCINMIHISPWEATLGLLRGAARLLPPGGPLVLYGPYVQAGWKPQPPTLHSMRTSGPATPSGASGQWRMFQPRQQPLALSVMQCTRCPPTT
jgi:SAM-dependent methyltransferase